MATQQTIAVVRYRRPRGNIPGHARTKDLLAIISGAVRLPSWCGTITTFIPAYGETNERRAKRYEVFSSYVTDTLEPCQD